MSWRAYKVEVIDNPSAPGGKEGVLTEVPLNTTTPSWNTTLLDIPPLSFDYGLYKLVFKLEVNFTTHHFQGLFV